MSTPFIGEIKLFAGTFAPLGWEFCAGQLLSISQNEALFAIIGTMYGGDGQSTFALPDLRGRAPIHFTQGYVIGTPRGVESVTLLEGQLPAHTHTARCAVAGNQASPANGFWAADVGGNTAAYRDGEPNADMSPVAVSVAGGNAPHENRQPFVAINYIISLFGIFPQST